MIVIVQIAGFTHRGECLEGAVGDLQDLLLAEFSHVEERRVEALELRLGDDSGPCNDGDGEKTKINVPPSRLKLVSQYLKVTRPYC